MCHLLSTECMGDNSAYLIRYVIRYRAKGVHLTEILRAPAETACLYYSRYTLLPT